MRELVPCGTWTAYQRHLRNGEAPCEPCRDANASAKRQQLKKHPGLRAAQQSWESANKLRIRERHLKRKYGMTLNQVEDLFNTQGRVCACCKSANAGNESNWCVDHDHETGRIRGIICRTCNSGIGQLGDTAESLQRAVSYLRPVEFAAGLSAGLL